MSWVIRSSLIFAVGIIAVACRTLPPSSASSRSVGAESADSGRSFLVTPPQPLPVVNPMASGAPTPITPQICGRMIKSCGSVPYTALYTCQNFAHDFYSRCVKEGVSAVQISFKCEGGGHRINGIWMRPTPPATKLMFCAVDPQAVPGPKNPDCAFTYESLCRGVKLKPAKEENYVILPLGTLPNLPRSCRDELLPDLEWCDLCCEDMFKGAPGVPPVPKVKEFVVECKKECRDIK